MTRVPCETLSHILGKRPAVPGFLVSPGPCCLEGIFILRLGSISQIFSVLKSLLNLLPYCFCFIFIFWLWGLWDLSSPTGNQAHTPCIKRQSINHWTTSKSQNFSFMLRKFFIYFQCFMVSLFFGPVAGGILVPQPGIKLIPPTVEAQSHNHWTTRDVLRFTFEGLTLPTWGLAKMMVYVHNLQESASFSGFPFPGHAAPAEGWGVLSWSPEPGLDWASVQDTVWVTWASVAPSNSLRACRGLTCPFQKKFTSFPSRNMTSFSIYTWVSFLYLLESFSSSLYVLWPYFFELNPR